MRSRWDCRAARARPAGSRRSRGSTSCRTSWFRARTTPTSSFRSTPLHGRFGFPSRTSGTSLTTSSSREWSAMGLSGLLLLNMIFLALGVGVIGLMRGARTWRELAARLGLAYLAGTCIAGIAAAELAVVNVTLGIPALAALATVTFVAGLVRFRRGIERAVPRDEARLWGSRVIGVAALVQTGVLLVVAGTAFAVRPLWEWDGWAIWGLKARALYAFGGVSN